MRSLLSVLVAALSAHAVVAHDDHQHGEQMPIGYFKYPYQAVYPGDNEGKCPDISYRALGFTFNWVCLVTADSIFSGITTFAKLPWVQCLGKDRDAAFDIAFIGAPFVSNLRHARTIDVDNIFVVGHGHFISPWCPLWSGRYSCRIPSFDFVWRLQRSPRCQPFPLRSQDHRLW